MKMTQITRRRFIQVLGGGTAAFGLGMKLPGSAWAQAGGAPDGKWADWEFYKPGLYDDADAKVLKDFYAELEQINKNGKNISINDVISGKIVSAPEAGPGGRGTKVTAESMAAIAKANVSDNPLFMDTSYAKKSRFGAPIAFPLISSQEVMPAMPKSKGIGDYMVVSSHNDTNSYYKPFYEGDTFFSVTDEQHCTDITPSEGSYYRTFVMAGHCKVYNQKGELVSEAANVLRESFRRHKDKSKRNPDGAHAWESPDWWSRPRYQYTDKDWDNIIAMWKKEKVRGADTLYWDEVKVGDILTPRAIGPLILDTTADMAMSVPQYAIDIKKSVLDTKIFPTMKKNKYGIWVLPEYLEKKAGGGPMGGGMPPGGEMPGGGQGGGMPGSGGQSPGQGAAKQGNADGLKRVGGQEPAGSGAAAMGAMPKTKEIANRDGRAVFQNSVAAKFAAGMICNWMGDAGWLQRVGWDIMDIPPGSDKSINYQKDPTLIPSIPKNLKPSLFDKYPFMEKVPSMKDKRANWHVLENDLVICNAYVTAKYQQGSEYFVDLTWWDTTYDGYIVEEGFATVKLPKKA
jgi:acyl dehydratase